MASTLEVFGATPFEGAPGIEWCSPWRDIGEPATDQARHEAAKAKATEGLQADMQWLLILAHVGGLALFTDGLSVQIILPSIEGASRLVYHQVALLEPGATAAASAVSGPLQ